MIVLTVEDVQTLVSKIGLREFYSRLNRYLKRDFGAWETFVKSPRHATHYPSGVIELMPVADQKFYAFKYVNGHPGNIRLGKSTVMATGQLSDVATGEPLLYAEMTLSTAFRTAATSSLAGEYMLNPGSNSMSLIGTGGQSEFQTLAFYFQNGIRRFRYFDKDPEAMRKFSDNLKNFDLETIPCKSLEEALEGTDAVTVATAVKTKQRLIVPRQISKGVFINAVGGDCPGKTELDEAVLENSRVVVEYVPQSLVEGEIQNTGSKAVHAELWELVTGRKKGRHCPEEVTLFDSVGFAIEDYSMLSLLYDLARELKVGQSLKMIPDLDNPKNIFQPFGKR